MVLEDGKWVSYGDGPFILKPAADYLPALITIRNRFFKKGERAISDEGASPVHLVHAGRFVYTADLEAPCSIENAILVLALTSPQDGRKLYIREIGDLQAHRSVRISIDEIVPYRLSGVRLERTYVFSNGNEVFTSEIHEGERKAALDRMVAKRVAAVHDAEIQPLSIFNPVYPASLKSKVKGQAVVAFRVDVHGDVLDPKVTSASDPSFGEAAVEAIRLWRFVPKVQGGAPVEAKATLPFEFSPP